jgi:hypothetical protein
MDQASVSIRHTLTESRGIGPWKAAGPIQARENLQPPLCTGRPQRYQTLSDRGISLDLTSNSIFSCRSWKVPPVLPSRTGNPGRTHCYSQLKRSLRGEELTLDLSPGL